ncbi:hypothetical protein C1H46_025338 [Malus baccata]|uniref:MADS-box domain-containing protein n=1 Tax=Malus baccata TaxID=106549 RepID=A0A540LRK5_MALBA|nr:hypothetical protein C1H46_025338 [Malus baccata]
MQPTSAAMPYMVVASSHLTTHPQGAYKCVTCRCHLNFHRRVTYTATSSQAAGSGRSGHHQHHVIMSYNNRAIISSTGATLASPDDQISVSSPYDDCNRGGESSFYAKLEMDKVPKSESAAEFDSPFGDENSLTSITLLPDALFSTSKTSSKRNKRETRERNKEIKIKREQQVIGRGKVQLKRIDDKIRRQVTFSKWRTELMKKAHELSVLYGVDVGLVI